MPGEKGEKNLTPKKHYTTMRKKRVDRTQTFTSSFSSAVIWRACCPDCGPGASFPGAASGTTGLGTSCIWGIWTSPCGWGILYLYPKFSLLKIRAKNRKFHLPPWRWSETERRGSVQRHLLLPLGIQGSVHLHTLVHRTCYFNVLASRFDFEYCE